MDGSDLGTDDIDYDDQRAVELSTLEAIFPELRVDSKDKYTFSLEVPVNPAEVVTVAFPAAAAATGVVAGGSGSAAAAQGLESRAIDSHELAYLPSVHLQISLPQDYPEDSPPSVSVSAVPTWLPKAVLKRLEEDCSRLWNELGHGPVVFDYIDHVRQAADDVFGLVDSKGFLAVSTEHKVSILDYDIKAKQAAFARETFECGVCLDPKKGSVCHRMQDCGHVFCVQCLQDFYSNAITEGDLASIRCLEPNCAKEREAALAQASKKQRKPKLLSVSPSELLQIPIEESLVKRYIDLKYKTELESDKNTIYCPRAWCNGAARSEKRKKPEGFVLNDSGCEDGDSADDNDSESREESGKVVSGKRLCICEECGFAFCSRCFLSWHGDFYLCTPRKKNGELTEEEKASLEYVLQNTTPCPTCAAPVQKTMGCNHMICFRCSTHFCYLCSAWLDPSNPYRHFGQAPDGRTTRCYNRLFELNVADDHDFAWHDDEADDVHDEHLEDIDHDSSDEEGNMTETDSEMDLSDFDDDDGEAPRRGGQHGREARPAGRGRGRGGIDERQNAPAVRQEGRQEGAWQVDVAREGPLVLRIALDPAPVVAPGAAGPAALAAPNDNNNNMHHNNGVARRGRGALVRAGHQAPARGRGRGRGGGGGGGQDRGRGRGGARRGRAGADIGAPGGGHRGRGLGRGGGGGGGGAGGADDDELDPGLQVWIRNFVQLALVDDED